MAFNLNDLVPVEVEIEFSEKPGKKYTLSKFSLYHQAWAFEKYGPEKLKELFDKQHLPTIAEIAYKLLKEPHDFPTLDDLMKCVVTQHDRLILLTSLLKVIGISQPVLKEIIKEEAQSGERESLKRKSIGAKHMISSQKSTATK